MFSFPYLIEMLTPKRSAGDKVDAGMALFSEKYERVAASGNGVSIPDNPMGQPRYGALETIRHCGLPVRPESTVMNLNTFHTKLALDGLLKAALEAGIKYLLVVRGDGGPALPKLDPGSVGGDKNVATSIDLMRYINTAYPDAFTTGAAFNQYNRMPFEKDRFKLKMDAGAQFVITQPVIGRDPNVDLLRDLQIPIVIEAWMSKNVDLLLKSVRRQKDDRVRDYDPVENLKILHEAYPESCIYLSMLSFKQDWKQLLPKLKA